MIGQLKNHIKSKILARWLIAYSPVPGIPPVVYKSFAGRSNITVIDIGAYAGEFMSGLTRICDVSRAILVEPLPAFASLLRCNSRFRSFRIEECGISDFDGEMEIQYYPSAPYISSALKLDLSIQGIADVARGEPRTIKCPARRLDTLVKAERELLQVDLLKIDVQGLEHKVIAGAQTMLSRTESVLTEVSFRPVYRGSSDFFEVYRMLNELGFRLMALEPSHRAGNGEVLQADCFFEREKSEKPPRRA
jgi:FkbM family methyltransferase